MRFITPLIIIVLHTSNSLAAPATQPATQPAPRTMRYTSRTPDTARQWQNELRRQLAEMLKIDDLKNASIPLKPRPILLRKRPGYTLTEMEISATPSRRIRVAVTKPDQSGPFRAAVVCIHGHGGDHWAVHEEDSPYKGFAAALAKRGVITIAPQVGQHDVYEPGRTLMGERLWDCMRCIDYLESLPEVDRDRIGCAGLSLGGEMAMWLGAMDERVAATVSCGFLTVMDQMEQGHCMCWKFPGLRELVDFADIYAMIAPRPLQCQNGRAEPPTMFTVELARRAMAEIEVAYRDFDASDDVQLAVHDGGHEIDLGALMAFLTRHLRLGAYALNMDQDRAYLTHTFDTVVPRRVENTIDNPIDNESGGIAWGVSYDLAAIVEMLDATRDPRYAELFVALADHVAEARDTHRQKKDAFRDRIVPAWGSSRYTDGKHYTWAVHTGMIAGPMARFAAVVRHDPSLAQRYAEPATRLLDVARDAVAVHDDQYREGPGPDEGHLFGLSLEKPLPLNMQNALARAWIAIDDATGKPEHRERITRLAKFFRNRMRVAEDGGFAWAYWPPLEGSFNGAEDISHAAINADFLVLCAERGIVFNKDDYPKLERTLMRVIWDDGRIANNLSGSGECCDYSPQILRWGRLARYRPAVLARLIAVGAPDAWPRVQLRGHPIGQAYLVHALNKAIPLVPPPTQPAP